MLSIVPWAPDAVSQYHCYYWCFSSISGQCGNPTFPKPLSAQPVCDHLYFRKACLLVWLLVFFPSNPDHLTSWFREYWYVIQVPTFPVGANSYKDLKDNPRLDLGPQGIPLGKGRWSALIVELGQPANAMGYPDQACAHWEQHPCQGSTVVGMDFLDCLCKTYQTTSCHPQRREDVTTGDTMSPRSQEIPDIEHFSSTQNK